MTCESRWRRHKKYIRNSVYSSALNVLWVLYHALDTQKITIVGINSSLFMEHNKNQCNPWVNLFIGKLVYCYVPERSRVKDSTQQDGALIFWLLPIVHVVDTQVHCQQSAASSFQLCMGLLIECFIQITTAVQRRKNNETIVSSSVLKIFLCLYATHHFPRCLTTTAQERWCSVYVPLSF